MDMIDFQILRDQWALKAPLPDKDTLRYEFQKDQQANPHNDGHGKKPRRCEAEIISDRAYTLADEVLGKQYPNLYKIWLKENGYGERWGVTIKEP
jgi:hypothetical protein